MCFDIFGDILMIDFNLIYISRRKRNDNINEFYCRKLSGFGSQNAKFAPALASIMYDGLN